MKKILFGTGNPAKLNAMRRRLSELDIEVLGLADMDREAPSPSEDGSTPLENARQKALCYYDFYQMPVFSCDSGLYFEDLPQELQPGIHVRNVGGKCLTVAVCLVMDREHIYEAMDDSTASEVFLITAVPYAGVRQKGFPLDSLSVSLGTGKYFYEMDRERTDHLAVEDGVLNFFRGLEL